MAHTARTACSASCFRAYNALSALVGQQVAIVVTSVLLTMNVVGISSYLQRQHTSLPVRTVPSLTIF